MVSPTRKNPQASTAELGAAEVVPLTEEAPLREMRVVAIVSVRYNTETKG